MTRMQLEHILRAAGAITDEREIVILGSQAILGTFPNAPAAMCSSMEADAFPLHAADKADLIDGTLGELSPFHETHGYYAHGVTPDAVVLADGWKDRLVRLQSPATKGVIGLCLSPADLAVSKLAAGRDKDIAYVTALLAYRPATEAEVKRLLAQLPESHRATVSQNLIICGASRPAPIPSRKTAPRTGGRKV